MRALHDPLPAFDRWLQRNVHAHKLPGYRAVTLSLKRAGLPPGDVTADQMEGAADLADRYSRGELRVTHDQNLLLPWVQRRRSAQPVAGGARRRLRHAQHRPA
jgi:sulfite reductase (NADPH) hemoprotein beta-component